MEGRLAGKVALITGAARGQGRAEAVRFAEEGASLIVLDIAQKIDSASAVYGPATREQLEETVAMCEKAGAQVHSAIADTRDLAQMESVARGGSAELGGLDVVVANAGIYSVGRLAVADERTGLGVLSQETWQEMLDVNLTGVYNTVRATAPIMLAIRSCGQRSWRISLLMQKSRSRPSIYSCTMYNKLPCSSTS